MNVSHQRRFGEYVGQLSWQVTAKYGVRRELECVGIPGSDRLQKGRPYFTTVLTGPSAARRRRITRRAEAQRRRGREDSASRLGAT
jgi:hypothetical protein